MKHIKIIIGQVIFLALVLAIVYVLYPKTNLEVNGNFVNFRTINANVIIISKNPDFSNPLYIDIEKNISIELNPGTYYWKSSNDYIESLKNKFTIELEVGMKIESGENESELVNVGNVKINVTKSKEGVMIGHIILEPEQAEEIEDSGEYTGGQAD